MKFRFLLACTLFCSCLLAAATLNAPETLNYKVLYKWGLINKVAGTATLTIKKAPDGGYNTLLTAKSAPWADKIFTVRDTLIGHMSADPKRPYRYEKIANEGGERKHDVVQYFYDKNIVRGECTRKVWKKGKLTVDEERTLDAEGEAIDMLSSFYFMRSLPFQSMKEGEPLIIPIFSGKRKETLSIFYRGVETVTIDKKDYSAYHVTFIFTSDEGSKTSDDMDAWICTDSARTPLKLEGKLPVGKVHCLLVE